MLNVAEDIFLPVDVKLASEMNPRRHGRNRMARISAQKLELK
jgi:hypothetical protein